MMMTRDLVVRIKEILHEILHENPRFLNLLYHIPNMVKIRIIDRLCVVVDGETHILTRALFP